MTSLRVRIALAMAVVAVTATVVVGVVTGQIARQRLMAEVDRSLEQASVLVIRGRTSDLVWPFARPPRIEAIVLPERTGLESVIVQVVRLNGAVVRSNSDVVLLADRVDRELMQAGQGQRFRTVTIDGERYRMRTVALVGGAVQTGRSLTETDRVLRELRARTLLWTTVIAGGAALGGWLLARRISRRLERLGRAAEQLASTGQAGPVVDLIPPHPPRGRMRDEVSGLSQSFGTMVSALARAQAEQERLVQDAGHELRTPLTSLRTNVEVLNRYPDLDPEMRGVVLDEIRRDVEELATLVNEIVDVASGARIDEEPSSLHLGEVVGEVVDRFRRRTGREVHLEVDDSLVLARRGGVERALANVLDNAHKFDPSDTPLDVRVLDGRLEVLDRGPGIPDVDRQRVFERFYRSDAARTLPGSGLGLSIVREVIVRDGGSVWVAAREGGGAVVGMSLPVVDPTSARHVLTGSSPHSEPIVTSTEEDEGEGGDPPRSDTKEST